MSEQKMFYFHWTNEKKREKGGNSPGKTGRVGAANKIVTEIFFFALCVEMCVCACADPDAHVCEWENRRDQFTVGRVRCLSSQAFILGMFVLV